MKAERVDTWAATIKDRPGMLAAKLKALAAGDVNLELVVARRAERGKGVVFVTPIKGAKQRGAAGAAGFTESRSLHTVRIEGANKPGQGASITAALGVKGINVRGMSAAAIGSKFIGHVALDTEADAVKAARIIRSL